MHWNDEEVSLIRDNPVHTLTINSIIIVERFLSSDELEEE